MTRTVIGRIVFAIYFVVAGQELNFILTGCPTRPSAPTHHPGAKTGGARGGRKGVDEEEAETPNRHWELVKNNDL